MQNAHILWVDDEIDRLKGHQKFLEQKGFQVATADNGFDALDMIKENAYDIIFLDEQMPGMDGLTALGEIQKISPSLPVVMITKSEEEHIMEGAIGANIKDYLIKPVNPSQILISLKKVLESRKLIDQKVNAGYQQDFRNITMQFFEDNDHQDWSEIYQKLIFWDRQLDTNEDQSMKDVLEAQWSEANGNFGKFVSQNYLDWVNTPNLEDRPMLSPDVLPQSAFQHLDDGYESVFFILVDCLRFDQWKMFEEVLTNYYRVDRTQTYYSILPTATQYARNAIFSGLHPLDISERYSQYWRNDDEEGGKNKFEAELLAEHLKRARIGGKHSYHKVITQADGKAVADQALDLVNNSFNAIVVNFIDLLSHSRTEMNIVRELAPDEAAYRKISRSWLEHSPLLDLLKKIATRNVKVVIATDHGTIRVKRPSRIIGDRKTTTNLRYKQGRNLNYEDSRYLFTVRKPEEARLPKSTVSASYVFAMEDYFFAYPNNYNHYVNYYRDTFQHGGVSMEEMVIPIITLTPKGK